MKRPALVCAALFALAIPSQGAARSDSVISRTFTLRWPTRVGYQLAYVEPITVPPGKVTSVRVFVDNAEVGAEPGDHIVACAHRDPSFASKSWLVQRSTVWVTVVLETGRCVPGPAVAGQRVRVRVIINVKPY